MNRSRGYDHGRLQSLTRYEVLLISVLRNNFFSRPEDLPKGLTRRCSLYLWHFFFSSFISKFSLNKLVNKTHVNKTHVYPKQGNEINVFQQGHTRAPPSSKKKQNAPNLRSLWPTRLYSKLILYTEYLHILSFESNISVFILKFLSRLKSYHDKESSQYINGKNNLTNTKTFGREQCYLWLDKALRDNYWVKKKCGSFLFH